MAVYERKFHAFTGNLTSERWRFLVLPRYAAREVFKSKLFIAFLVICFLLPLIDAVIIYLPHNETFANLLAAMSGNMLELTIGPSFYLKWLMIPQGILCFLLSLIVGPSLVSGDLRNNALPLYLARPFSRKDYILGKMSVLIFLLSAITWLPGLLLYSLQAYLSGFGWLTENLRTPAAIFFGSWILILMLCLISLALSAYMRWKPVAQAAYFGLILVTAAAAAIINLMFRTDWGSLINISDMLGIVWAQLFALRISSTIPPFFAWLSLLAFCSACLLLLVRKVRAYEIVK